MNSIIDRGNEQFHKGNNDGALRIMKDGADEYFASKGIGSNLLAKTVALLDDYRAARGRKSSTRQRWVNLFYPRGNVHPIGTPKVWEVTRDTRYGA